MIDAVVLDIGGVLEHTPRTGWQARWASRLEMSDEELRARLGAILRPGATGSTSLAEVERLTAERLGIGPAQRDALMAEVWAEYLGTLNAELAAWFAALRPRYRTGILSNSFVGAREREAAAYGFEEMCDTVVYSDEEGMVKPDPRFYRLVCERLGVAPERAVFVDDVAANVDGARAVGMQAVHFTSTPQTIAAVQRLLDGGAGARGA